MDKRILTGVIGAAALAAGGVIYAVSGDNGAGRQAAIGVDTAKVCAGLTIAGASGTSGTDATLSEGNSGTSTMKFAVAMTNGLHCGDAYQGVVHWRAVNETASDGSDYISGGGGTVPMPTASGPSYISIPVNGDVRPEYDERFRIELYDAPVGQYVFPGRSAADGVIVDDDAGLGPVPDTAVAEPAPQPSTCGAATGLSVSAPAVREGDAASGSAPVYIYRCGDASGSTTVSYATATRSADGDYQSAEVGTDYTATSGTVTFAAGETRKSVPVKIVGNTIAERAKVFDVRLSAPSSGATIVNGGTGEVHLFDDDVADFFSNLLFQSDIQAPGAHLWMGDAQLVEGNSGASTLTFQVRRTGDSFGYTTVGYSAVDGTATAGTDFQSPTGKASSLTFAPGDEVKTVAVSVFGDTALEPDETFQLKLGTPTGGVADDPTGTGTIRNDDNPTLSINDVSVTEGNAGTTDATFTIARTGSTASASTVTYYTVDGSATAKTGDYVRVATTSVQLAAGEATKAIIVKVNADTTGEAAETFTVKLASPTLADILDPTGVATIVNDDAGLSVDNVSVTEGNAGTTTARFAIHRSGPTTGIASVNWTTVESTSSSSGSGGYSGDLPLTLDIQDPDTAVSPATAGPDYKADHNTVTFAAGESVKYADITVNGDTTIESNEVIQVQLSSAVNGTIVDDTGTGTIVEDDTSVSVSGGRHVEGNTGTLVMSFSITRLGALTSSSQVNWATADLTASADTGDYRAASGTVFFAPGEKTASVGVTVDGDTDLEADETMKVYLFGAAGATLGDSSGIGTITDDDCTLVVDDAVVGELNAGSNVAAVFAVHRTGPTTFPVNFTWTTRNGSTDTHDYTPVSETKATIPGGSSETELSVIVTGDNAPEGPETFGVVISAANMTLFEGKGVTSQPVSGDNTGVATIIDNDAGFAILDAVVAEGNTGLPTGVVAIQRVGPVAYAASIKWATSSAGGDVTIYGVTIPCNCNPATVGTDYRASAATAVSWAANDASPKTVNVVVVGDTQKEGDETFHVILSSPTGGAIIDDTGVVTIRDDD